MVGVAGMSTCGCPRGVLYLGEKCYWGESRRYSVGGGFAVEMRLRSGWVHTESLFVAVLPQNDDATTKKRGGGKHT